MKGSIEAVSSLPGGVSGVVGNEFYANLLGRWLTNDTYPFRLGTGEIMQDLHSQQMFKPASPGNSNEHRSIGCVTGEPAARRALHLDVQVEVKRGDARVTAQRLRLPQSSPRAPLR